MNFIRVQPYSVSACELVVTRSASLKESRESFGRVGPRTGKVNEGSRESLGIYLF